MLLESMIMFSIIYLVNSYNNNHTCPTYLRELADKQSKLIYCITAHSVPVTMCISCQENYSSTLQIYDELSANCSNKYFDKDRINLVASTESVITALWSKAYCDDCFNNNNYAIFNEKNKNLVVCLNTHKDNPCEDCKMEYLDLNDFYIHLDQHNNGEVCYDLQDSMNRTRYEWSKEKNCCRREQNLTLFIIVLCTTFSLPVLFYGTSFWLTKRQERYHRILFDEEPISNSEISSFTRQNDLNDINNPTQSMLDNSPSSSNAVIINATATIPANIHSNENLESSDDDMQINTSFVPKNKIGKI